MTLATTSRRVANHIRRINENVWRRRSRFILLHHSASLPLLLESVHLSAWAVGGGSDEVTAAQARADARAWADSALPLCLERLRSLGFEKCDSHDVEKTESGVVVSHGAMRGPAQKSFFGLFAWDQVLYDKATACAMHMLRQYRLKPKGPGWIVANFAINAVASVGASASGTCSSLARGAKVDETPLSGAEVANLAQWSDGKRQVGPQV